MTGLASAARAAVGAIVLASLAACAQHMTGESEDLAQLYRQAVYDFAVKRPSFQRKLTPIDAGLRQVTVVTLTTKRTIPSNRQMRSRRPKAFSGSTGMPTARARCCRRRGFRCRRNRGPHARARRIRCWRSNNCSACRQRGASGSSSSSASPRNTSSGHAPADRISARPSAPSPCRRNSRRRRSGGRSRRRSSSSSARCGAHTSRIFRHPAIPLPAWMDRQSEPRLEGPQRDLRIRGEARCAGERYPGFTPSEFCSGSSGGQPGLEQAVAAMGAVLVALVVQGRQERLRREGRIDPQHRLGMGAGGGGVAHPGQRGGEEGVVGVVGLGDVAVGLDRLGIAPGGVMGRGRDGSRTAPGDAG